MKGLYLANAPATEQATEIGLTAEKWDECRAVYSKDEKGSCVFNSL